MAYEKINFEPGDVLTAEQVNLLQDEVIRINNKTPEEWGATPAGYGIGKLESYSCATDADVDNTLITQINGMGDKTFKRFELAITSFAGGGGYFYADVYKLSTNYAEITIKSYLDSGRTLQRSWYAGQLNPWEWVNPPMKVGVEYRTTERFLGESVYVKMVDVELTSDSANSRTDVTLTDDVTEHIGDLVRIDGYWLDSNNCKHPFASAEFVNFIEVNSFKMMIYANEHGYAENGYAIIYYTKRQW